MARHHAVLLLVAAALAAKRRKRRTDTPSVVWHAPFFAGGGYCSEATDFALALDDLQVDVAIEMHGDSHNNDYMNGMAAGTLGRLYTLSGKASRGGHQDVAVCHSEPGAWHVPTPSWPSSPCPRPRKRKAGPYYVVGRTMFETDRLPEGWAQRLNSVDEVWVPTEFQREIFLREGVHKVHVVGEPVDVQRFTPDGPVYDISGVAPDAFVVVSVFKWERRKGWDVLLRAWHRARLDGVLVIVTNAYHSTSNFEMEMDAYVKGTLGDARGFKALGRVKVLSRLADADMEALYRRADLVALPTRGEGWGRPHVEAMASGTPVAATNWSGSTAYLDETCGFPLAWTGLEPVGEGPFASHRWAAPDAEHLAAIFAEAVADPARLKRLGERARNRMVERYAPAVLAAEVRGHLRRVRETVEARRAGGVEL